MQIEINDDVAREFEYIVQLHQEHGAPAKMENIEMLINHILTHVANGSRRPGSWERGLLVHLGLVADCDEHHQYRSNFGAGVNSDER